VDHIDWVEGEAARTARWRSESGMPPPKQMAIVDDTIRPDDAYGLAGQGTALLWRGDFPSARHLLAALAKRVDYRARKSRQKREEGITPAQAFHLHRQAQAQKARLLGMLLVQLEDDYHIKLPRAQDVKAACREAWGDPGGEQTVVALRELLGVIGAHEWRTKGLEVPGLGGRIHPHYGVFTPTRSEYLDLIAKATFPAAAKEKGVAFDIGTGTGVVAAMLARHAGIARIVATDIDPRALACARENVERLSLADRVEVVEADLFPEGRAGLAVCNPPWLPARPSTPLEKGIYDPESRMLKGFLAGLADHLVPGGEGWLIVSDLAERLGLRAEGELAVAIDAAGLVVKGRTEAAPRHPKAADKADPLHAARTAEVVSLCRLAARG
jgi:SAM-dependent methyltransferase